MAGEYTAFVPPRFHARPLHSGHAPPRSKNRKANFTAYPRQVPRGTFRRRNISRLSKRHFASAQSSFHILQIIIL
jgi:hypothetical protein